MRKVTENAVNAFFAGRNWAGGNTTVQVEDGWVQMRLHGHKIAWRHTSEPNEIYVSQCGWPTVTTRERLNAVLYTFNGLHMSQSKHKQYIGNEEICPDSNYMVFAIGSVLKVGDE